MTPDELNAIEARAAFHAHAILACDVRALVAEVRELRISRDMLRRALALHEEADCFNAGIEKCAAWHEEQAAKVNAWWLDLSPAEREARIDRNEYDVGDAHLAYAASLRALKETT